MSGAARSGEGVRLSRRRLLGLAAAAGLAACSSERIVTNRPEGAPEPSPTAPERPTPATSDATPPLEPSPTAAPTPIIAPFEPHAAELGTQALPNAKRLAGRIAQELTTYAAGEPPLAIAARALRPDLAPMTAPSLAAPEALAATIGALVTPGTRSIGEVVYPQLGGDNPRNVACSVMVVVRQTQTFDDGREAVTTRVLDVRLRTVDGLWAFEALASEGGIPVPAPTDLSEQALAVLTRTDRIDLPDSARWDINSGLVDDSMLTAMLRMADLAPYAVTVLSSGHSANVFNTERASDHSQGRAVDVWRIGDAPVIAQQPDQATAAFQMLQVLFEEGVVRQIGSPWNLDPAGGRSFTDNVHLDHLHVAVSRA